MILLAVLFVLAELAFGQTARISVIAHRGEHLQNPENSVSGIRAAIELGADYVELDVRTTSDGRMILMHDATVDRTSNGKGLVKEIPFAKIREFRLGQEKVPTFEEALDAAHGRMGIYVDAKDVAPAALVHAIEKHDMRDSVVIYGAPEFLKSVRSLRPEIRLMPEAQNEEHVRALLADLHPAIIAFDERDFKGAAIDAAKSASTGIFVDRLGSQDNPASWQDAISRGATGIQTDKPAELVAFLQHRNLRPATDVAHASSYEYFLTGNAADVQRPTSGGILMAGGGKDVDDAFRWLIKKAGGGDIVILRASGGDGYNGYIRALAPVDSVESIVTRSRAAASDPSVLEKVRKAEALFIAGGDQWNYIRYWKGTPLEDAIHFLVKRGIPVGGTSAGLAIQGQHSFSAEMDTITSAQALADPFDPHLTIESAFLRLPNLNGVITDSHFSKRDRLGRLVAFLARIAQTSGSAKGVGIDERAAVLMEPDGSAAIAGEGAAYFLRAGRKPEICVPGQPLTFENIEVYRVPAGGSFDFRTWTGTGGFAYRISARSGVLSSTQEKGSLY
jgi:cyanophycinase